MFVTQVRTNRSHYNNEIGVGVRKINGVATLEAYHLPVNSTTVTDTLTYVMVNLICSQPTFWSVESTVVMSVNLYVYL